MSPRRIFRVGRYEWLNDTLGHVTHGSILVPYWPWRLSHKRHHMHHNHVDKDYSHVSRVLPGCALPV
jgi:fatty acid desaturase